jgi:hypothetical protein
MCDNSVRAAHKSDVRGVSYDHRSKCWRADWQQHDGANKPKHVNRGFSVKEHGYEDAKRKAEAARTEAVAQGIASVKAYLKDFNIPTDPEQLKSALRGVTYNSKYGFWVAQWLNRDTAKHESERFLVTQHGFHDAKEMAEQFRQDVEAAGMVSRIRADGNLHAVVSSLQPSAAGQPSAADLKSIPGVIYLEKPHEQKFWQANWITADGRKHYKTWNVSLYGFQVLPFTWTLSRTTAHVLVCMLDHVPKFRCANVVECGRSPGVWQLLSPGSLCTGILHAYMSGHDL